MADNALEIYGKLSLTNLTGINYRYEARLNRVGIYSPLQFLAATQDRLKKQVFHSIVGYQWFSRLRGWEVDNVVWDKKSVGHNYALGRKTRDRHELSRLLMKLTHKVGRRMRSLGFAARGIYLALGFRDGDDLRLSALSSCNSIGNAYQVNEKPKGKSDDLSDVRGYFSVECDGGEADYGFTRRG